ncbi:RNA-binding S4 domain-containing protein [Candidatus Woesearchaeota archaeon]|nr:RNA-binding S4 domain-containing protein [Candidatus Woesearchaeota archaeon]
MKYIELNTFLNISGVASSGGEAKQLIRSEAVKVNGEVETRNKKKLVAGDKVVVGEKEFVVVEDVCQKEK